MALNNSTLDTLIVKATNPLVDHPDPLDVASFCEKVTHEMDGPQIAVKLLAYRIHSPQEKEALNALALLEQCVKSCGPTFHSEIGKFRFLNELIKLVSPKYQAHRTPNQIRHRILDILYTWTIDLKSEPKILEAYDMLKKQGVIKENPKYLGTCTSQSESHAPPAPREKAPFFDNSEKDALLQKLLKSKNPEDLQAANRLIKSMVREEENRLEAASRRQLEIETVTSNIRLLEELLDNCENNGASAEEVELCKELASNCDRLRPNLSKLATETDDKGDTLADILRTSDELSHVLERYEAFAQNPRLRTPSHQVSGAAADLLSLGPVVPSSLAPPCSVLDDQLISLGLDDLAPVSPVVNLLQPQRVEPNFNGLSQLQRIPEPKVLEEVVASKPSGFEDLDLLGEALLKQNLPANSKTIPSFQKAPDRIPLNELAKKKTLNELAHAKESPQPNLNRAPAESLVPVPASASAKSTSFNIPMDFDLLVPANPPPAAVATQPVVPSPVTDNSVTGFLVPLSGLTTGAQQGTNVAADNSDTVLLGSGNGTSSSESSIVDDVQLLRSPPNGRESSACQQTAAAPALGDVAVKFEDIKPSSKSPIPLLVQESGLTVNLLSASAQVPKNVSVFVVTVTSCNSSPITNFTFQAIVPKGNRVKLQPPSDNKLPAFNPFLPPPAITQIMLLSTPGLNLIELKFVVSFEMDGETVTEMGSVKELALKSH